MTSPKTEYPNKIIIHRQPHSESQAKFSFITSKNKIQNNEDWSHKWAQQQQQNLEQSLTKRRAVQEKLHNRNEDLQMCKPSNMASPFSK